MSRDWTGRFSFWRLVWFLVVVAWAFNWAILLGVISAASGGFDGHRRGE